MEVGNVYFSLDTLGSLGTILNVGENFKTTIMGQFSILILVGTETDGACVFCLLLVPREQRTQTSSCVSVIHSREAWGFPIRWVKHNNASLSLLDKA